MNTDEDLSRSEDEYAIHYFGFVPQTFMNGMYNLICEYLKEAIQALNDAILIKFKGSISEDQLQEDSHDLIVKAVERLDEKFDKAQNYLINNVFKLPDHLVLPEDKCQVDGPCSEEEMSKLDENIQNVIDRIDMVRMANFQLRTRMAKIDTLQKELNLSLEVVTMIRSKVHSESSQVLQGVTDLGNIQKEFMKLDM